LLQNTEKACQAAAPDGLFSHLEKKYTIIEIILFILLTFGHKGNIIKQQGNGDENSKAFVRV
jgi:hypothetical protein